MPKNGLNLRTEGTRESLVYLAVIELKEKAVTTAESTTGASPFGCLQKSRHCVFKLEFVSRNDLSQSLTHLSSSNFDLNRRFDGLWIFYSPWHKHDSFRAKVSGAIHFCRVQVNVSKSLRKSHKIFKVTWFHLMRDSSILLLAPVGS